MIILFKIASRERPEQLNRTLQSIYDNVVSDNYKVVITVDHDDKTFKYNDLMNRPNVQVCIGNSRTKIEAINANIPLYGWDILVNVSDDQVFTYKGFDDVIRNQFKDNLKLVLHIPDNNRADLMTMSIIGYDYYMIDRYIYQPDYIGSFCDNEAQTVAQKRHCYRYFDKLMFNHNHPNYGLSGRDALYKRYDAWYTTDQNTFIHRQANNFYL